jgi:uncharacterized membrane protein
MKIKVTPTKVIIALLSSVLLIHFSYLLEGIPCLFVTVILIGIIVLTATMGWCLYPLLHFLLDKMNGR